MKGDKFPNTRKPSHQWVCGEFWNLRGHHKVKERKKVKSLSCVRLFATLWTVARQAPPSLGFSRQEYWSGLPFPSPRDVPNPGIGPRSPTLQADALTSEAPGRKQHNREGKKKKKHRIRALTTTPSGEISQMLTSATSEWGRHCCIT